MRESLGRQDGAQNKVRASEICHIVHEDEADDQVHGTKIRRADYIYRQKHLQNRQQAGFISIQKCKQ